MQLELRWLSRLLALLFPPRPREERERELLQGAIYGTYLIRLPKRAPGFWRRIFNALFPPQPPGTGRAGW